jgi:hypothetical protein
MWYKSTMAKRIHKDGNIRVGKQYQEILAWIATKRKMTKGNVAEEIFRHYLNHFYPGQFDHLNPVDVPPPSQGQASPKDG